MCESEARLGGRGGRVDTVGPNRRDGEGRVTYTHSTLDVGQLGRHRGG